jgi:TPR repeat protein
LFLNSRINTCMKTGMKIGAWGSIAAVTAGMALWTSVATAGDLSGGRVGTTIEAPSSHEVSRILDANALSLASPGPEFKDDKSVAKRAEEETSGATQDAPLDLHLEGFLAFDRIPTGMIQSIVKEADAGNPQARYSLAKLMHACRSMLDRFPDDSALVTFLTEADRSRQPELAAGVEREAGACLDLQAIYGSRERTAQEWMQLAAEQGYGPALAALAGAWAWQAPLPSGESAADVTTRAQLRRVLVEAAVRTRDPNALFAVSGFFGAMGPMNKGQPGGSLAWNMAACHFGLDCGPDNWFLQWMCRYAGDCGESYASGLIAYLEYKQYSPSAVDYADRRAPELIGQLEAGDWDALDIVWSGDPGLHEVLAEMAEAGSQASPENE